MGYSLAHRMYETNRMWMRPLAAEFPADKDAIAIASQWFDGDLLVSPVLSQDSQKQIYLPAGTWYSFNTSTVSTGPAHISGKAEVSDIPVFVSPGAIVPLSSVIQYTGAVGGAPLEVQIYGGANSREPFVMVEDDGETTAYERGAVRKTRFDWDDSSKTLSWKVSPSHGSVLPNSFTQAYATLFMPSGVKHSAAKILGQSGSIAFPASVIV